MKTIIGLTGRKRVGKSTVASRLVCSGFYEIMFAYALKLGCMDLFNLTHAQLFGHLKEVVDPRWNKTPREIMQYIGTSCRHFVPGIWLKHIDHFLQSTCQEYIVISDVRYPDEAAFLRSYGAIIIRIERDIPRTDTHESETQVIQADYTIENNGTFVELFKKVDLLTNRLASNP